MNGEKLIDVLKDRKILTAALVGYLGPKILRFLGQMLFKKVEMIQESQRIFVGIELGGTNFNIAIASPQFDKHGNLINFKLLKQMGGRTSDSYENTLVEIIDLIKNSLGDKQKIYFVGIAAFGPIELKKQSINYGYITSTPKKGWKNAPVLPFLKARLDVDRIQIETDVNAAGFAEFKLGNHKVKESLAYITVGTGVGVGVITHKKTVHGLTHPEGGHIIVKRHPDQIPNFHGVCPFHSDCLEGMVANRSISTRTGIDYVKLNELEDSDKIWQIIGNYLAQLCLNITLTVSPEVIVIGGGIMNRGILLRYIHRDFLLLLAKYVEHRLFTPENVGKYIVLPDLGSSVGVKGGLLLKYL